MQYILNDRMIAMDGNGNTIKAYPLYTKPKFLYLILDSPPQEAPRLQSRLTNLERILPH
jgi:hypothetical protein